GYLDVHAVLIPKAATGTVPRFFAPYSGPTAATAAGAPGKRKRGERGEGSGGGRCIGARRAAGRLLRAYGAKPSVRAMRPRSRPSGALPRPAAGSAGAAHQALQARGFSRSGDADGDAAVADTIASNC
ncbi:unnamed protein product, partial [Laminaria digitata]